MQLKACFFILIISCSLIRSLCSHEVYFDTPARMWLENTYLPSLSGRILYVGVGSYTQHYPSLTQTPLGFMTLDYDEEKVCFGSPYGHYTEDLFQFQLDSSFDHVSLFGIMGHPPAVVTSKYNIIDEETISKAFYRADQLVKTGGTLQIGPNYRDFPGQDAKFWLQQFIKPPLDQYEIVFLAVFSDNIVWWGKKVR